MRLLGVINHSDRIRERIHSVHMPCVYEEYSRTSVVTPSKSNGGGLTSVVEELVPPC